MLILGGAQQGLDLLARCLIDPGDAVIVDRPGYLGAIQSFRAAGAKLIGWDVAAGDVDELEDLLVRYRPKLVYTNPTFQNPTGITMPILPPIPGLGRDCPRWAWRRRTWLARAWRRCPEASTVCT